MVIKMKMKRWLLMVLLLPSTYLGYARQSSESSQFQLETHRNGAAKFNFEIYNNLLVVPVLINSSKDTLKLILDTGVGKTLITGLPNQEEINLRYAESIRIAGLGEGDTIEAFYSRGNKVVVDQITGLNQDIVVLKEDIFHLSNLLGTYVHGLIGYSIFRDFIVEIDYDRGWIKFHDHERFGDRYQKKKNSGEWSSVPLSFSDNKPYVEVEVVQNDGSRIPLTLLIDSGASHALSLYYSANSRIHLPGNRIRSFLGNGLSGEIRGYLGRVKTLVFGDYELHAPISSYPDEEGIQRAVIHSTRDGSLGADILKRFKVMFNYRDSTMIIKPSDSFGERFLYNLAGMEVATPYPNIRLYQVTHIREGSVADDTGIRTGDYITEINRITSTEFSLNDVLHLFRGEKGERISFKLVRNDSTFRKNLTLVDELD